MPSFSLTFSNRFECLLDRFLDRLADLPHDPFEPVQYVVPGSAVRRRLELAIADRQGICANIEFSFLAGWLWRVIGQVVPVGEQSPFDTDRLQWRLFDELDDPALAAAHPRLGAYLARSDAAMRLALAQKIAAQFDQLITYRADWLQAWLAGRSALPDSADPVARADEPWQAELWRRLARATGVAGQHPSALFFKALADGAQVQLPGRLTVFGPPAIPPLYLQMLRGLAGFTDIELYAFNPCREYWFEIVAPRRLGYLRVERRDALHEVGHPLLAAWGRQTQAYAGLLLDDDGLIHEAGSRFEPAVGELLLAQVQNAILDLADPPDGSVVLSAGDRSIELHVCHSPMRELQVLHDQLLRMFDEMPGLRPADIAVLLPDLADAAPLIDAVFGSAPPARRIPFVVSGLPRRQANGLLRALDGLMRLLPGRLPASEVFELMEQPPVARCFGWAAEDLERLREWLDEAGIRWGLDDAQRTDAGLPSGARAAFDDGLRRLYLAYAAGGPAAEFDGWLGAGSPQGGTALLLGSFNRFVEILRHVHAAWSLPAPADTWRERLLEACELLFPADVDHAEPLRELRAGIGRWHQATRDAQLRSMLDTTLVRETLMALLDEPPAGAVPTGAVTFAAIGGLRGLPFRVVCVLGLNDHAFPRPAPPVEFDLIARVPRVGDRQRRDDERTLFLDLLLAARERFYLSHTGRHARDNSRLPPSVLVSELFEHLGRVVRDGVASLVVEHPLAAFSIEAFEDDPAATRPARIRSYHTSYARALRARLEQVASPAMAEPPLSDEELDAADAAEDEAVRLAVDDPAAFFLRSLPAPPEPARTVPLDRLVGFFRNPCAALLRRLGIVLPRTAQQLSDDEPLAMDWRAMRRLSARLLPAVLEAECRPRLWAIARAGVEAPAGELGNRLIEQTIERLILLADRTAPHRRAAPLPAVPVCFETRIGDEHWSVQTTFTDLRPDGLLRLRDGAPRVDDRLAAWLAHLLLNHAGLPGDQRHTRWFGAELQGFVLRPVDDAGALLRDLLRLYREGLMAPLRFFPQSAWAFAESDWRIGTAQNRWLGSPGRPGERDHAAYRLALRGVADPLDRRFVELARQVFEPMRASCDEAPR